MSQKIVVSRKYGEFDLSPKGWELFLRLKGLKLDTTINQWNIARNDPALVQVVEKLGSEKASGKRATLWIVEIPDGVEWEVNDYDGLEWVSEKHRRWYGDDPKDHEGHYSE